MSLLHKGRPGRRKRSKGEEEEELWLTVPTNKACRPLCSPSAFVSSFSSLSTLTQSFFLLSLFCRTLCSLFHHISTCRSSSGYQLSPLIESPPAHRIQLPASDWLFFCVCVSVFAALFVSLALSHHSSGIFEVGSSSFMWTFCTVAMGMSNFAGRIMGSV